VAIGHEDVAVRGHEDIGRPVECVRAFARHARLAERHQHFALRAELEDLLSLAVSSLAVSHPHVAVTVHMETMWNNEHTGAERVHQFAGCVELQQRRHVGAFACVAAASLERPDAPAVAVGLDSGRAAKLPAVGKREVALDGAVRVRLRIGLRGRELSCERRRSDHNAREERDTMDA
jgi:hypothetical protein